MNVNKQIKKEIKITLVLYLIYFSMWYYFAYIYPPENVEDYEYIFGLPSWFFYSCVLSLVLINVLVYISVRVFFKDIKLEESKTEKTEVKNKKQEN